MPDCSTLPPDQMAELRRLWGLLVLMTPGRALRRLMRHCRALGIGPCVCIVDTERSAKSFPVTGVPIPATFEPVPINERDPSFRSLFSQQHVARSPILLRSRRLALPPWYGLVLACLVYFLCALPFFAMPLALLPVPMLLAISLLRLSESKSLQRHCPAQTRAAQPMHSAIIAAQQPE